MKKLLLLIILTPFMLFSQEEDDEYKLEITYNADSAKILDFFSHVKEVRFAELSIKSKFLKEQYDGKDSLVRRHHVSCFWEGVLDTNSIDSGVLISKSIKTDLLKIFLSSAKDNMESVCYNPRNSISFFGSNKALLGYMEICFECERVKFSTDFGVYDFLPNQYEALEELFILCGLIRRPVYSEN